MKTLHITNHIGTKRNILNVFKYLGIDQYLTTLNLDTHLFIDTNHANEIWNRNKYIIKEYDCLFFTDTSMYAMPYLQHMEEHNCIIIIYITNRFDFGTFAINQREEMANFYSNMSNNKRVIFCSDNKYDMYYASLYNIKFYYESIIRLTPIINENIIMPTNNKLCICYRGTKLNNYNENLEGRHIKYDYFENDNRYRDEIHLCEYIGICHLPYQTNIQSLWENLGYSIIYFIPSKTFMKELIKEDWYYFEEKYFSETKRNNYELLDKSIEYSEWYQPENSNMFEFFDSWDDLRIKYDDYIEDIEKIYNKKTQIKISIQKSNTEHIEKWKKILGK